MRSIALFLALAPAWLASCAAPGVQDPFELPSTDPEPRVRNAFLVGERRFDGAGYQPVDEQFFVGYQRSSVSGATGIGHELGLNVSYEDQDRGGARFEGTTFEGYGGLRVEFDTESFVRPYLGVGASATYAQLEVTPAGGDGDQRDDIFFGLYFHGGLAFEVTDSMDAVIDLRYTTGENAEFRGVTVDSDALVLAIGVAF